MKTTSPPYSLKRIMSMEARMTQVVNALQSLDAALSSYTDAAQSVALLKQYYGSEEWRRDHLADEAGLLPTDLLRGVLSEDGLWNLLNDWSDMQQRLQSLLKNAASTTEGGSGE